MDAQTIGTEASSLPALDYDTHTQPTLTTEPAETH